jgi:hypothetical protein
VRGERLAQSGKEFFFVVADFAKHPLDVVARALHNYPCADFRLLVVV